MSDTLSTNQLISGHTRPTASKFAFEEVYNSKIADGFGIKTYRVPELWKMQDSGRKAIGVRRAAVINELYTIEGIATILINYGTVTRTIPFAFAVNTSARISEVGYKIEEIVNTSLKKDGETCYLAFTFEDNKAVFTLNILDPSKPVTTFQLDVVKNFLKYFNQPLNSTTRLMGDIGEDEIKIEISNVWDHEYLAFHCSLINNTNHQYMCLNGDFYPKPKMFVDSDKSHLFKIWMTYDGITRIDLLHVNYIVELVFVIDDTKALCL